MNLNARKSSLFFSVCRLLFFHPVLVAGAVACGI